MTASEPASGSVTSNIRKAASMGNWRQRLRLWSGLTLFTFCLSHFLNHAMGIISFKAMDQASLWHYAVWRSDLGEAVLFVAALTHVLLALWRTSKRRTLFLPPWEFTQLVLGLYIPWLLIPHVVVTMGLPNMSGFSPTYAQMLTMIWPNSAFSQSLLLVIVWTHAMIGLHFWLRLYPIYRRLKVFAAAFAIAVPVLALWGWIEAARRLALTRDVKLKVNAEQFDWVVQTVTEFRAVVFGLVALSLFVVVFRYVISRFRRGIEIRYPGDLKVRAPAGPTLLEISRMKGIPHAAVCGGRARCSTCRVKVLYGLDGLGSPATAEAAVLGRIGADEDVRLACQIRPQHALEVLPLVPARTDTSTVAHAQDAYHWGVEQDVAIMFVDLRNFTGITEAQLAYDVVFLLNQYLDRASQAIRAEGGHIDKFIGDGIMAIFGMQSDLQTGSRQALKAAKRLAAMMEDLNSERGPQFKDPLRIGIGLHGGHVILGRIGAAGGGGTANVTALGDVVNTASRLETENKAHDSTLAVSRTVLEAAGVDVSTYPSAEIQLRGKENFLQMHPIKDLDALAIPDKMDA